MKTITVLLGLLLLVTYGSTKPTSTLSTKEREILTQLYESLEQKEHDLEERANVLKSTDLAFKGGKGKSFDVYKLSFHCLICYFQSNFLV